MALENKTEALFSKADALESKYNSIIVRGNQNLVAIIVAGVSVIFTVVGLHFLK